MRSFKAVAIVGLALGVVGAAKHTVVKGDTLWDISGKYLRNPFQWEGVWKVNPQVKNPHWIYPGDIITLPGDTSTAAVDTMASAEMPGDTVRATDTTGPLSGFLLGPDHQVIRANAGEPEKINLVDNAPERQLNPESVLLAPLWLDQPDRKQERRILWEKETGVRVLLPGHAVRVALGSNDGVKVGDVLEVVELGSEVATIVRGEMSGRLEQLRAYFVVSEVGKESSLCLAARIFGKITAGAQVRPSRPVATRPIIGFDPVESKSPVASAIVNTSNSTLQVPGNYIILDRGRNAHLEQGDIVEFMDALLPRGKEAWRGVGIVVRSDADRATVFLNGVADQPVRLGDKAYVVRRAVAN